MTGSPVLKRLLDTGMQYTEMSQKNAEKIVSEFVKAGQVRRKDAEKVVQRLVERGRSTTEHVVGSIVITDAERGLPSSDISPK